MLCTDFLLGVFARVPIPACVVYSRSTENDPHSRRILAEVVHHQRLLIGGATDDENDDIQRSASHESKEWSNMRQ